MGYNSVVLILNDCLAEIEQDKNFGKKVSNEILKWNKTKRETIYSGCCTNAAEVLSCEHADVTQIIAVGGNCGEVLINCWHVNHSTKEGKIQILKDLADKLGYRVVK